MENSLVETKQAEHVFLYEEFNRVCPYFISIGMTYEQFWYGNPLMVKTYQKAFELKEKRESYKERWSIWEQGLYTYEAICDVSPVLRAFSKATKPLRYPSKPYNIDKFELDIDDENKKKEEKQKVERMKTQIFFENWAKEASKRFDKKGG